MIRELKPARIFMGSLERGSDLLEGLTAFCRENRITLGSIVGLGAVKRANLGYFDQSVRSYRFIAMDRPLEITSLIGNLSLKDGEPFLHAHVTLGDGEGRCFGGHLGEGNVVWAFEFTLKEYRGGALERAYDPDTRLSLWKGP